MSLHCRTHLCTILSSKSQTQKLGQNKSAMFGSSLLVLCQTFLWNNLCLQSILPTDYLLPLPLLTVFLPLCYWWMEWGECFRQTRRLENVNDSVCLVVEWEMCSLSTDCIWAQQTSEHGVHTTWIICWLALFAFRYKVNWKGNGEVGVRAKEWVEITDFAAPQFLGMVWKASLNCILIQ